MGVKKARGRINGHFLYFVLDKPARRHNNAYAAGYLIMEGPKTE